ncbi:hypothetical protein [Streptomyces spiramenti]|uniref:hypothetical protein n=1 Tax=Streptomyces spiramenti TaxID=2720606 RepID=UPI0030846036
MTENVLPSIRGAWNPEKVFRDAGGAGKASALPVGRGLYDAIDISGHRNNTAVSAATETTAGEFNVWRNSFAAEYLPAGGSLVHVDDVPFRFPPVCEGPDNIRCSGQFIRVPEGRYDWIHVLAASERRTEDTVELSFADGSVDAEALRVSDFWAAPAWFGETKAFESLVMHYPHHVQRGIPAVMWAQRVPVTRRTGLTGILLPRNVAVHVFALTLQRTET